MWSQKKNTNEIHHHAERVHGGSYTTLHVRKLQLLGRSQVDSCFSKGRALRGFQGWLFRIAELKDPLLKMKPVRCKPRLNSNVYELTVSRNSSLLSAHHLLKETASDQNGIGNDNGRQNRHLNGINGHFVPTKTLQFLILKSGLDLWVPKKTSKLTRWAPY